MLCHLPVVDVCGRLYDLHITDDTLHGGVEHTGGMLHRFLLHVVSRLAEQDTQRQRKDGDCHQQDAEAKLPRKRLADMSDDVAHLFLLFHDSLRIGNQLVQQSGDFLAPFMYLIHQAVGFFLREFLAMVTNGLDALEDAAYG